MSMRGGGGRGGRISSGDAELQKRLNAEAPRIPHLFRRIASLFAEHRVLLILTGVLVLVGSALTVIPPLLTQRAFDDGLFPGQGAEPPNFGVLVQIVLLMLGIMLVIDALGIAQTYFTSRVGNTVTGALRVRLFETLQSMELSFFTKTKTGVIQSRLQNDVGGVASVLSNTVSSVVGNTVTVIAALVSMIILSWQLTIVALVVMPFLVIVQRKVGQIRARIATATQESLSEMTAITQESLSVSGILLAKSFNRQESEVARYAAENERQVRLQIRQQMSGQWFFAIVQVILAAIPAVIYIVAAQLILGGVELTAGTIVAFTTVQARLLMPLVGLMRVALDLQTSGALFARIFEYLDLVPSIHDRPDARPLPADAPTSVEFRDVVFRYPDAEVGSTPTLKGVSFTIAPGEFVAFVGPSGAGKTTVGYLIPRFQEVSEGALLVGGVDVREVTHSSLVDRLGVVSQETYLFHATIAENLRYAKPEATDAELEQAARAANIHDTIVSFADGYDTIVGERGYRLSGGEKQRVAIARVLLKNPSLLILDEATSALDTVSERVVQHALEAASQGRTTIAIAHRLSTIIDADRIFVLQAGAIAESGTHAELLDRGGLYAEMYQEQRDAAE